MIVQKYATENFVENIADSKQEKNLIVSRVNGLASHTPTQILEHIYNGGKVVFNDGGTEHGYLEGNSNTSIFYSSFVSADKIQFTMYEVFADGTIKGTRSSYVPPIDSSVATKDYVQQYIEENLLGGAW